MSSYPSVSFRSLPLTCTLARYDCWVRYFFPYLCLLVLVLIGQGHCLRRISVSFLFFSFPLFSYFFIFRHHIMNHALYYIYHYDFSLKKTLNIFSSWPQAVLETLTENGTYSINYFCQVSCFYISFLSISPPRPRGVLIFYTTGHLYTNYPNPTLLSMA